MTRPLARPEPSFRAAALPVVLTAAFLTALLAPPAPALESDRQQPLEINADQTVGSLGDGRSELRGNVLIRQGSMVIKAEVAEVEKVRGKVREVVLTGDPVHLEQEIEQQGLVQATADRIEYSVAAGLVTLMGSADVNHPQYRVSGDLLKYDLDTQHFQGSGEPVNGRIRIELDPELIENRGGDEGGGEGEDPVNDTPPAPGQAAEEDENG